MVFNKQQFQQQSGEMQNQASQFELARIWKVINEQREIIETCSQSDKKTAIGVLKATVIDNISYCMAKKNKVISAAEVERFKFLEIEPLLSEMGKWHIIASLFPSSEYKGTDFMSRSKLYWEKSEQLGGEVWIMSREIKETLKAQLQELRDKGKIIKASELEEETLPSELWMSGQHASDAKPKEEAPQ
jgi:DNA-binding transcriptional regulator PaaX